MVALIITLIVVGLVLLIAELLVIPGFGIAGILGIASLVASCWIAFDSLGQTAGLLVIAANILFTVIMTVFTLRSRTWKRLSLKTNIDAKVDTTPQAKGIQPGITGISLTRLAPGGQARFGEITAEVSTRDALIEPGKPVIVSEIEGNRIFVKQNEKETL